MKALHLIVRILLGVALVVLLVANGVKQAPRLVALAAPPSSGSTVAAGASPSAPEPAPSATEATASAEPSATPSLPPLAGTGGGTGTGTGGGASTPKPSKTPTTPRAVITAMYADGDVRCAPPAEDAPGATQSPAAEATIHWRATGSVGDGYFGINTSDAQAAPYATTHASDSITVNFPCSERKQVYTVTVLSQDGTKVSRSITVRNIGSAG